MKSVFIYIVLFFTFNCFAQTRETDTLFVASWNLENLFDTVNDTLKRDEEFLPGTVKNWNDQRLDKKLYNLARVIRSMNNGCGPDILGVVETEHQSLLDRLNDKYLQDMDYSSAYLESPDNRGIDNGLFYRKNKFRVLSVTGDTIHLPDGYPTRLILKVDLLTGADDTLYVFINHWPSRRGGEKESEINRITAAEVLKKNTDDILSRNPASLILIMGDFNDEPTNNSIFKTLKAQPVLCDSTAEGNIDTNSDGLYNLSYAEYNEGIGSYKYRNDWNMLDQLIVSKELLTGERIRYICNSFEVYKPEFMVTESGKYKGTPFPTYGGNKYLGGYSDHFPVISKFIMNK